MRKNDYYSIACDDLKYLQATLHTGLYNQISVQAEQVVEKMLKSVAERVCVDIEGLLKTHNLRALYDRIHAEIPSFMLNRDKLSTLKDYYYDTKYPGDNFVEISYDMCLDCLRMMYSVIESVNIVRRELGLDCEEYSVKYLADVKEIAAF